jgi:hypothetical protein
VSEWAVHFTIELKIWQLNVTLSVDCPYSRMTYSFFTTAVPGKQKIVIWVGRPIVISDRYCCSACVGAFGRLKLAVRPSKSEGEGSRCFPVSHL